MSWFRLDDQGAFHAKVIAAGNEAYGAWCRAGQWSSLHGTEGKIPRATALTLARQKIWQRLVDAGLCESLGDEGWLIHDFLDYNPTAEEVRTKRESRAEAGRRGGLRSGEVRAKQTAKQPRSSNEGLAKQNSTPIPIPIPIPERDQDPPIAPKTETSVSGDGHEGVPDSIWRLHEAWFVSVYETAAREAMANPRWSLRRPDALRKVLKTCCLGEDRGDIDGWIQRKVATLAAFVRDLPEDDKPFWNDVGPAEMQRWFNRPGSALNATASKGGLRPSQTRLKPATAPDEAIPPMTPEEAAEWKAKVDATFAEPPPRLRQVSGPDEPLSAEEIREAEERRQAARARRGVA